MNNAEQERIRSQIAQMLRRAPDKVSGASVQVVRDFTKFHKDMTKLLQKQRITPEQMISAYNQTMAWYS